MLQRSTSAPERIRERSLLPIAFAIGFAGTIADLALGPAWFQAAPHICAAAIVAPSTRRSYWILVNLLAAAITLPALIPIFSPTDGISLLDEWIPRFIGLGCLAAVVGVSVYRDNRMADPTETTDRHIHVSESVRSIEEPSTFIRLDQGHLVEPVEDHLAITTCGDSLDDSPGSTENHVANAITRLRDSGQFDDEQMKLIESELQGFEESPLAVASAASLTSGDEVGRFVIEKTLGRGGVASVYSGHDGCSGEPAAIKILHNVRFSERFRREMFLVQQLAHPNIVTAYEAGEFRGLPFIAMELLPGPDLNIRIRDDGPLDWLAAARCILQTSRALEHAHQRDLIHRDIKPGNIIIGGRERVKLADLGLAAISPGAVGELRSQQHETQEGQLAGTLPYMAPEQARCLSSANFQSDIYSLGATWHYLLTGKPRLRGETLTEQLESLLVNRTFNRLPDGCMPDPLCRIYRRLVAYDPNDRFANCGEVVIEMERALASVGESVSRNDIQVLVVEDSRTDMLKTIEMLRRTNRSLSIHEAKSLASGITTYRELPIDLILLDLTLPDSSGAETVTRFREAASDVPIVVLSGACEEGVSGACLEAGATDFVSKSGLDAHGMERIIFVTLSRYTMTHNF